LIPGPGTGPWPGGWKHCSRRPWKRETDVSGQRGHPRASG